MIHYFKIFDDEIENILNSHNFTAGKILASKQKKYLLDYIFKCTQFLPITTNITTRAFFTISHRSECIKCIQCGNDLKNQNIRFKNANTFEGHFCRFCSVMCEMTNEQTFLLTTFFNQLYLYYIIFINLNKKYCKIFKFCIKLHLKRVNKYVYYKIK